MTRSNHAIKFVKAQTFHRRLGAIKNRFHYRMDSLLIPVGKQAKSSSILFSLNKFNLFSFSDKDHGEGKSLRNFAEKISINQNFKAHFEGDIWLLTQPRFLGYVFNPVSFWFFLDHQNQVRAVVAEVNNTAKGRHFYICRHDDFSQITEGDKISVNKLFYVSPFQDVKGEYEFKFKFDKGHVGARINYKNGEEGVYTSITGSVSEMNAIALIKSALLRPFGALRVISLIHWQALKLKLKGGHYRKAPVQKEERISR